MSMSPKSVQEPRTLQQELIEHWRELDPDTPLPEHLISPKYDVPVLKLSRELSEKIKELLTGVQCFGSRMVHLCHPPPLSFGNQQSPSLPLPIAHIVPVTKEVGKPGACRCAKGALCLKSYCICKKNGMPCTRNCTCWCKCTEHDAKVGFLCHNPFNPENRDKHTKALRGYVDPLCFSLCLNHNGKKEAALDSSQDLTKGIPGNASEKVKSDIKLQRIKGLQTLALRHVNYEGILTESLLKYEGECIMKEQQIQSLKYQNAHLLQTVKDANTLLRRLVDKDYSRVLDEMLTDVDKLDRIIAAVPAKVTTPESEAEFERERKRYKVAKDLFPAPVTFDDCFNQHHTTSLDTEYKPQESITEDLRIDWDCFGEDFNLDI